MAAKERPLKNEGFCAIAVSGLVTFLGGGVHAFVYFSRIVGGSKLDFLAVPAIFSQCLWVVGKHLSNFYLTACHMGYWVLFFSTSAQTPPHTPWQPIKCIFR
jgi:hypothetical protein